MCDSPGPVTPPSGLPAISPTRGEISSFAGRPEGRKLPRQFRQLPPWLLVIAGLTPTSALAHASDRGYVLLLPTGYYLVGGALAVAASFIVLMFASRQALEHLAASRFRIGSVPEALRLPASLISFLVFATLVSAGFLGSRDPLSNPLPLVVWTLVWVGLTLLQGLFGNLWAWINPWYGPWRMAMALLGRAVGDPPLRMPAWLSLWPALALLIAFAWFELIYPAPDDPWRLAWAVGGYWLFSFAMMLLFGYEQWSRRGEFLSVFFGMIARFGIVARSRDDRVALCLPGAKLADTPVLPLGGTLFLLFALASVSFDGLSKTFFYFSLDGMNPLEPPGRTALIGFNTAGLLAAGALLAGAFFICVLCGEKLAGGGQGLLVAAGTYVWSIVPIALAYHFSHYLTALLVNGQYALVALSDPFSLGWNLFGTSDMPVMAGIAVGSDAAWVVWNAQAAAIVGGHVLAVLAAHLLAFRLHATARAASASQLPLTFLMIAYTVFGLWLLSTPTAG